MDIQKLEVDIQELQNLEPEAKKVFLFCSLTAHQFKQQQEILLWCLKAEANSPVDHQYKMSRCLFHIRQTAANIHEFFNTLEGSKLSNEYTKSFPQTDNTYRKFCNGLRNKSTHHYDLGELNRLLDNFNLESSFDIFVSDFEGNTNHGFIELLLFQGGKKSIYGHASNEEILEHIAKIMDWMLDLTPIIIKWANETIASILIDKVGMSENDLQYVKTLNDTECADINDFSIPLFIKKSTT